MFKDKLKEYRKNLGLSQEELGKKIFVSRSAVAKWEQGRGMPTNQSMQDLANLFNVSVEELYDYTDVTQLKKKYKGWKLFSIISIFILLIITGIVSVLLICNNKNQEAYVFNSFFKKEVLKEYHFQDYTMPYFAAKQCVYNDTYYACEIERDTYPLEYVYYTFNYLLNEESLQPYIYVSGDYNLMLETGAYNKQYYVKTTQIEDCGRSNSSTLSYGFYYTYEKDSKFLYSISIHYEYSGSTFAHIYDDTGKAIYDFYKQNVLTIQFEKIPMHTERKMLDGSMDIYQVYLCEEDQVERIPLNQNNFKDYFSWSYRKLQHYDRVQISFGFQQDFKYFKYFKCNYKLVAKVYIDGIIYEKIFYSYPYGSLEIDQVKEVNTLELEIVSVEGLIYRMLV